ncbi:hypothetical protein [Hankyongella ginsenosidimutans]|uniref:hypothetical protein n=1 Tax=Hankyongella ginsenosidimutans TaxID=1763828 RepID=UPI0024823BBC|nr:hypothetical protein [Hankyongella ginsenosidimutans]
MHWSPFLRALATREPERLVRCCTLGPDAMAAAAIEAARPDTSMAATMRILRQTRQDLAFACAIADIAGLWPLERVCGALSDYADAAIEGHFRPRCRTSATVPIRQASSCWRSANSGRGR